MNGVIIVDKPAGWTSHDVVAKLRGIYQTRRIGHTGTLDPMATGVLVVFLGRATRAVELCENDEKEYHAGMRLGLETNTQDTTGETVAEKPVEVTDAALQDTLQRFTGRISQIPPMYSAIKVGGKKLYEIARKGGTVERKPREITIHELELISRDGDECQLRVRCSKGTYIRTLCSDIGTALGCGGCMSSLRRSRAGQFTLSDAVTMEAIQAARDAGTHEGLVRPLDSVFAQHPSYTAGQKQEQRCRNGNDFPCSAEDGIYRVYSAGGEFLMLGRAEHGVMKTIKSFFEVN